MEDIQRYIDLGKRDKFWYERAEQLFVDLFGKDNLWLVTRLFAATSINTSLKANITLFRRALYEHTNNLPVGHYLPNIQNQIKRARDGKEITGLKISSFARAMSGDKNAVVVDLWLSRAFKFKNDRVTSKEYHEAEQHCRNLAIVYNCEPRHISAMIWCGIRTELTKDKETHYENILRFHFTNLFNCI